MIIIHSNSAYIYLALDELATAISFQHLADFDNCIDIHSVDGTTVLNSLTVFVANRLV